MIRVWNRVKDQLAPGLAWWLLALTGILLRLRQYTANRSLWADEASLAYNLANRSFAELMGGAVRAGDVCGGLLPGVLRIRTQAVFQ